MQLKNTISVGYPATNHIASHVLSDCASMSIFVSEGV